MAVGLVPAVQTQGVEAAEQGATVDRASPLGFQRPLVYLVVGSWFGPAPELWRSAAEMSRWQLR